MKRSEMILKIAEDLRKHENLFIGYKKERIDLRCATDNLAVYLLNATEKAGMLPPSKNALLIGTNEEIQGMLKYSQNHQWEPEE